MSDQNVTTYPLHYTIKDLRGKRFGHLLVVDYSCRTKGRKIKWRCLCDCGKTTEVSGCSLKKGSTRSCGCNRVAAISSSKITHGLSEHPLFCIWASIMQRCYNPTSSGWKRYGGRGIRVDERWHDVTNFISDMTPRPTLSHTIGRIDNNGNYSKENCQWETRTQQARNMRSNRVLTLNGVSRCLMEWSQITGIGYNTLRFRLSRGWSTERTLTVRPESYRAGYFKDHG